MRPLTIAAQLLGAGATNQEKRIATCDVVSLYGVSNVDLLRLQTVWV